MSSAAPIGFLMLLAPPLAGCVIGLLLSLARRRPGRAAIGGSAGGIIGAWLGVALYRWVMNELIGGRDINIFAAITIGCFLLGAIPLGWCLSGQKIVTAGSIGGPGCGLAIGCCVLTAVGVFLYGLASERSALIPIDESVKYVGIACILCGAATLAIALAWMRGVRSPK
jgi:hypothetical protein